MSRRLFPNSGIPAGAKSFAIFWTKSARVIAAVLLVLAAGCAGSQDVARDDLIATPTQNPNLTASPAGWFAVAPAPLDLTEVAAAGFAGSVWVVGGMDTRGQAARDVQVYDPDFDTWAPGPELLEPLHHASLVSTGSKLWVIGGYRGPGYDAPTAQVWVLDSATGDWAEGPALPEARAAGAAAWDGDRIVYGGGVGSDREPRADVFALHDGAWETVTRLSQPREHLGAASDGEGTVWFMGGRRGSLATNSSLVEVLQGEELRPGPSLPTPRGGVGAFWAPQTGACLLGGESNAGTYSVVECVDANDKVRKLPAMTQPRHGLGVALVDGIVYAAVGGPVPGLSATAIVEALHLEALAS